jgi:hypothetical protein
MPPQAPIGLSISQYGTAPNVYPYLTWYQSNGALGYTIYRQDPYYGTYSMVSSTDQYTTYFQDMAALTGGVTYYYKVSAWNSYGESTLPIDGVSYYAPMSGNSLSPPNAFTNGSDGRNWVQVAWYSVTGASSYSVEYSSDEQATWNPAPSATGLGYTYYYFYGPTSNGMTAGQTYWFRVTAYDTMSHSAVSTPISYAPPTDIKVPVTIKPY